MIASPLSLWQGVTQSTRTVDARVSVSALFSEWQGQFQRNLTPMIINDSTLDQNRPTPGILQPIGESSPHAHVKACITEKYRSRQAISAIHTATNGLELVSWRVSADGSVIQTGTSGVQRDRVAQLDMARAHKFVVAYRSLTQQLVLVSWSISNTGAIYRAGEHQVGEFPIRSVKVAALTDDLLVTACLTKSRHLRLTSWRLDADAAFTALAHHEVTSEHLRHLTLVHRATQAGETQIAIIARTASGHVLLQRWQVTAEGQLTLRSSQQFALEATHVQAVRTDQGGIIMALRTRQGRLRLLNWQFTPDQETVQLCADTGEQGPPIRRFDLVSIGDQLLGAFATQGHQLWMRRWRLNRDGTLTLREEAASHLPVTGPVHLCPDLLAGNAPLLAGLFTAPGDYQLTTWST